MLIVAVIDMYKRASKEKSFLRAMLWLLFTRLHDRRATVNVFRFNSNVKGLTSGDAFYTDLNTSDGVSFIFFLDLSLNYLIINLLFIQYSFIIDKT